MELFEELNDTGGAYSVGSRDIAGSLDADFAPGAQLTVGAEEGREAGALPTVAPAPSITQVLQCNISLELQHLLL